MHLEMCKKVVSMVRLHFSGSENLALMFIVFLMLLGTIRTDIHQWLSNSDTSSSLDKNLTEVWPWFVSTILAAIISIAFVGIKNWQSGKNDREDGDDEL